ncbi:hypothetical protein EDD11_005319 [Mortierella claussenii]|nr:hypothetical protein EDD11_005319 [Mortierella claussenii]
MQDLRQKLERREEQSVQQQRHPQQTQQISLEQQQHLFQHQESQIQQFTLNLKLTSAELLRAIKDIQDLQVQQKELQTRILTLEKENAELKVVVDNKSAVNRQLGTLLNNRQQEVNVLRVELNVQRNNAISFHNFLAKHRDELTTLVAAKNKAVGGVNGNMPNIVDTSKTVDLQSSTTTQPLSNTSSLVAAPASATASAVPLSPLVNPSHLGFEVEKGSGTANSISGQEPPLGRFNPVTGGCTSKTLPHYGVFDTSLPAPHTAATGSHSQQPPVQQQAVQQLPVQPHQHQQQQILQHPAPPPTASTSISGSVAEGGSMSTINLIVGRSQVALNSAPCAPLACSQQQQQQQQQQSDQVATPHLLRLQQQQQILGAGQQRVQQMAQADRKAPEQMTISAQESLLEGLPEEARRTLTRIEQQHMASSRTPQNFIPQPSHQQLQQQSQQPQQLPLQLYPLPPPPLPSQPRQEQERLNAQIQQQAQTSSSYSHTPPLHKEQQAQNYYQDKSQNQNKTQNQIALQAQATSRSIKLRTGSTAVGSNVGLNISKNTKNNNIAITGTIVTIKVKDSWKDTATPKEGVSTTSAVSPASPRPPSLTLSPSHGLCSGEDSDSTISPVTVAPVREDRIQINIYNESEPPSPEVAAQHSPPSRVLPQRHQIDELAELKGLDELKSPKGVPVPVLREGGPPSMEAEVSQDSSFTSVPVPSSTATATATSMAKLEKNLQQLPRSRILSKTRERKSVPMSAAPSPAVPVPSSVTKIISSPPSVQGSSRGIKRRLTLSDDEDEDDDFIMNDMDAVVEVMPTIMAQLPSLANLSTKTTATAATAAASSGSNRPTTRGTIDTSTKNDMASSKGITSVRSVVQQLKRRAPSNAHDGESRSDRVTRGGLEANFFIKTRTRIIVSHTYKRFKVSIATWNCT